MNCLVASCLLFHIMELSPHIKRNKRACACQTKDGCLTSRNTKNLMHAWRHGGVKQLTANACAYLCMCIERTPTRTGAALLHGMSEFVRVNPRPLLEGTKEGSLAQLSVPWYRIRSIDCSKELEVNTMIRLIALVLDVHSMPRQYVAMKHG